MRLRERIVKALFGDMIQEEVEKSSKQGISHVAGISLTEGVLPEEEKSVRSFKFKSWLSTAERCKTLLGTAWHSDAKHRGKVPHLGNLAKILCKKNIYEDS